MFKPGVYRKGELELTVASGKILSRHLSGEVGAIVTFTGVTKAVSEDGRPVSRLLVEAYKEQADKVVKKICREVKKKYGVAFVGVYHLVGEFKIGEPIVHVIVASKSRREAFEALTEAVKRYKSEPALWKKEVYSDGSSKWISHQ